MNCQKCGSDCVSGIPGTSHVASACSMCGLWCCSQCRQKYGFRTGRQGEEVTVWWCGDIECKEGCDELCDE